jgi:hypothetical protein
MWVMNRVAENPNWSYVQGSSAPFKNAFPNTGVQGGYNTAYIYPVYIQDSFNTINGTGITKTTSGTYDTVRARLMGSTANTSDAPEFDTAYFTPAMPSSDMNCTTSYGCWVYAGPDQYVSLSQGQQSYINLGSPTNWSTPTLPPGTYTFQLKGVTGDLDLYVKKNGMASSTSYDCRPYLGRNQDETCTMTLTQPGTFSVWLNGYASQTCSASPPYGCTCPNNVSGCPATATLIGSN